MKSVYAIIALMGSVACAPVLSPLDPNAEREALSGAELEARIIGKRITLVPDDTAKLAGRVESGYAIMDLHPNHTAGLGIFDAASGETLFSSGQYWKVMDQGICISVNNQFDRSDCRTVGWVQGNRLMIVDVRGDQPELVSMGQIGPLP